MREFRGRGLELSERRIYELAAAGPL